MENEVSRDTRWDHMIVHHFTDVVQFDGAQFFPEQLAGDWLCMGHSLRRVWGWRTACMPCRRSSGELTFNTMPTESRPCRAVAVFPNCRPPSPYLRRPDFG
eukprot:gene22161-biopygen16230